MVGHCASPGRGSEFYLIEKKVFQIIAITLPYTFTDTAVPLGIIQMKGLLHGYSSVAPSQKLYSQVYLVGNSIGNLRPAPTTRASRTDVWKPRPGNLSCGESGTIELVYCCF